MKKYILIIGMLLSLLFVSCKEKVVEVCKDDCYKEITKEVEQKIEFKEEWESNPLYHYHVSLDGVYLKDNEEHDFLESETEEYIVKICKICHYEIKTKKEVHEHFYNDVLEYDSEYHFYRAICCEGERTEVEAHTFSSWEVTIVPTVETEGLQERNCEKCGYVESEVLPRLQVQKIKKLKPGDTVALLNPASQSSVSDVNKAKAALEDYGFNVKVMQSSLTGATYSVPYLALSDAQRAKEINDCFKDDSINGIICMRGGYGSSRTLDLLDYETIKAHPKFFIGYSDITALINAFYFKCGFISYQGFMGSSLISSSLDQITKENILSVLFSYQEGVTYNYGSYISKSKATVRGTLIGGNLSLFTHLLGSEYLPNCKDKIIFIEDTGEGAYQLDRMFTKLRLFGVFNE